MHARIPSSSEPTRQGSSTATAGTARARGRHGEPAPTAGAPARGAGGGRSWAWVASGASGDLADLLPDALAQAAEHVGRHHLVRARPRQRDFGAVDDATGPR